MFDETKKAWKRFKTAIRNLLRSLAEEHLSMVKQEDYFKSLDDLFYWKRMARENIEINTVLADKESSWAFVTSLGTPATLVEEHAPYIQRYGTRLHSAAIAFSKDEMKGTPEQQKEMEEMLKAKLAWELSAAIANKMVFAWKYED